MCFLLNEWEYNTCSECMRCDCMCECLSSGVSVSVVYVML